MSHEVGRLLRGHRFNAVLSWTLVGFLSVAVLGSVARADLLWAGFALVVAALAALPAVSLRNPYAMLPWEVTLLTALPVVGRSFATVPLTSELATYVSVAAISLVVSVELHLFTPVRMTDWFAVALVVVGTMATAGVWAVVRWAYDVLVAPTFFLTGAPEAVVEHQLMLEFVSSTAAGVLAGLFFALYVRRRLESDVRFPEGVPR